MVQSISFITRYWFSISLVVIVSLSVAKRVNYTGVKTHSETTIAKAALVPVQAKLVTTKTSSQSKAVNVIDPLSNKNIQYSATEQQTHRSFIKRFSKVAVDEMTKFGIPASIILAHALLECDGKTGKDNAENNFFNLPCKKTPATKSCSREYKSAWFSFRDHSKYITSGKFKYLPRIPVQNLEEWAKGIQVIGYPNQLNYNERLLEIINQYKLNQLDIEGVKA